MEKSLLGERTVASDDFYDNQHQQRLHQDLSVLQKVDERNEMPDTSSESVDQSRQLVDDVQSAVETHHNLHHLQQRQFEILDSQCISNDNINNNDTTDISAIQALGPIVNMNEKVAIYRHPLFPLLRVLFEKCELATNSIENVSTINFQEEIKNILGGNG